jgi:anhydro-N-acetylmuramic acid kinase
MNSLYLGLISGTSADGIDAALLDIDAAGRLHCRAGRTHPYPAALREAVLDLQLHPERPVQLDALGQLDAGLGEAFADAAEALLAEAGVPSAALTAIGSHGQTVRHRPQLRPAFTLQLGDPSRVAERLRRPVVADFRRRDVAAGGEGAPLVPAFHAALLKPLGSAAAVLNLGGIANVSLYDAAHDRISGFDVGPANTLLDAWHQQHRGGDCDRDGAWAASAEADAALLADWLTDPYFHRPPPKSTGREHFHLGWITAHPRVATLPPAVVQATLLALTVQSVVAALAVVPGPTPVYVHGGGWHNRALMQGFRTARPDWCIDSTGALGVDPDHLEAALFAWLAHETLSGRPGNRVDVTGAAGPRVLGAVWPG